MALLAECTRLAPNFAGHYMNNYVFTYDGRTVLARQPRGIDDFFDPRMIQESDALTLAGSVSARVPDVVFADDAVLVETFCTGELLDFGQNGWETSYQAALAEMTKIYRADASDLKGPQTVTQWWTWMERFACRLWERLKPDYHSRYRTLGLTSMGAIWSSLSGPASSDRKTCLVHGDLHEANILIDPNGHPWLLDWELALKADPLWDAAVSLHRSHWSNVDQRDHARTMWIDSNADAAGEEDVSALLDAYTFLERWKSVV